MIVCSLIAVQANFSSNNYCRLQIEQENMYCDKSDVDPLALSLRSVCFLSASQILFASY